jgi:hypothetical protein
MAEQAGTDDGANAAGAQWVSGLGKSKEGPSRTSTLYHASWTPSKALGIPVGATSTLQ